MQFLFPSVLWALGALSIPILVHFFNFRKTRKIYFSNVNLLKSIETKTSSFRKLKDLILLLLRLLALACLIVAFAQPFFSSKNTSNKAKVGINGIYIDNSLSMQNLETNKRLLDLAVIKVDEMLTLNKNATNIQLGTNDFSGDDNFILSASKAKDLLTNIDFSNAPKSINQVMARQKNIANKNLANAENHYYWFSDFQKSTAGDLNKIVADENNTINIVPLNAENTHNVFVQQVSVSNPLIRQMVSNNLEVKMHNSGKNDIENLSLKLFIDNIQSATATVSIKANSSNKAIFNFNLKNSGRHKCKVVFDDEPVVFDNEYFFVLNASPTIQVMHLFAETESYIKKLFSNDSLFNFQSFSISNFDPNKISTCNFLILEGVNALNASAQAKDLITKGGSVVFIPSAKQNLAQTAGMLKNFGVQNLIPIQNSSKINIEEPDKSNRFFMDVFEKNNFQDVVSLPQVALKYIANGPFEKLISLENKQAYISRTKIGNGYFYFVGAPLHSTFGNFAEHAYFVPTFLKMATSSATSTPLAYNFKDSQIQFVVKEQKKNAVYKLKNNKIEIVPAARLSNNLLTLEMPNFSEIGANQNALSGFFDVLVDDKIIETIAINHDEKESEMDFYSANELKEIFKDKKYIKVFDTLNDQKLADSLKSSQEGHGLWKYFIWAALFFILAEILVLKFYKK